MGNSARYSQAFLRAVAFTLKHEGGLSDHPNDPGGVTKYGLTVRDEGIDPATLTVEQAIGIYHRKYWRKVRGDELPPAVGFVLFDYAVNAGIGQAVKDLQRVVRVKVDGVLGPKTLAAVQSAEYARAAAKAMHTPAHELLMRRCAFQGRLVKNAALRLEAGEEVPKPRRFYYFTVGWWKRTADQALYLGEMEPALRPKIDLEGMA